MVRTTAVAGLVVTFLAVGAAAAAAAEIQVCEHKNYGGRCVTLLHGVNDLREGMSNLISSFPIRSGTWRMCGAPNLQGACQDFTRSVPDLAGTRLQDSVSSLRPGTRRLRRWRNRHRGLHGAELPRSLARVLGRHRGPEACRPERPDFVRARAGRTLGHLHRHQLRRLPLDRGGRTGSERRRLGRPHLFDSRGPELVERRRGCPWVRRRLRGRRTPGRTRRGTPGL